MPITTALTEFSDNGNSRTFTVSGHSVQTNKLVIQKRVVPQGNKTVAETSISVIYSAFDAEGNLLPSNNSITVTARTPRDGRTTDLDDPLALFREIVANPDFESAVRSQNYISS